MDDQKTDTRWDALPQITGVQVIANDIPPGQFWGADPYAGITWDLSRR